MESKKSSFIAALFVIVGNAPVGADLVCKHRFSQTSMLICALQSFI